MGIINFNEEKSMRMERATEFAKALAESIPGSEHLNEMSSGILFNPYRDKCLHDIDEMAPTSRLGRLARHLDCDARFILVGEAPGYRGCRYSGIAFTSEHFLMGGMIPRLPKTGRLTDRNIPFSEPSAHTVWGTLYQMGIAEHTVLWNAVQLHPHEIGNAWSNRTPSKKEVAHGRAALHLLHEAFPDAKIIAVGKKADTALNNAGIKTLAVIRHPSFGGAVEFSDGLSAAVKQAKS